MSDLLKRSKQWLQHYRRKEDGAATIEFILVFPILIALFLMAFEFGLWQTRQVLLDYGLDRTIRSVRLGTIANPDHETLVEIICDTAGLIPNCEDRLTLQMFVTAPDSIKTTLESTAFVCADRAEDDAEPLLEFTNTGGNNDLMFLRACVLFDPFASTSGVGQQIAESESGTYAIVSTSSYVIEPFQ